MARKHLWTAAALLVAAGCGRDDVAHYRVPKADPTASSAQASRGGDGNGLPPRACRPRPTPRPPARSSGPSPRAGPRAVVGRDALRHPEGHGAGQDRRLGHRLSRAGRRRARQREPLAQPDRPAPRRRGGPGEGPQDARSPRPARVAVFDYTSDGKEKTRLVAGILFAGGNSWFVKMVGDAGPVAASRADFVHLLESLRLADR